MERASPVQAHVRVRGSQGGVDAAPVAAGPWASHRHAWASVAMVEPTRLPNPWPASGDFFTVDVMARDPTKPFHNRRLIWWVDVLGVTPIDRVDQSGVRHLHDLSLGFTEPSPGFRVGHALVLAKLRQHHGQQRRRGSRSAVHSSLAPYFDLTALQQQEATGFFASVQ